MFIIFTTVNKKVINMHKQSFNKLSSIILINFLIVIFNSTAFAQDISNEQRNAYEARKTFNKKASAHQNLSTKISQQEKRVEEEQARLNKLVSEEQAAKRELDQAKLDLENKVNKLNDVWDLRDQ